MADPQESTTNGVVQLKSFRYVELDDSTSGANKSTNALSTNIPLSSSYSSSSCSSNVSSYNADQSVTPIFVGGNLTANEESDTNSSSKIKSPRKIKHQQYLKASSNNEDGENTTLSSNEEYQMTQHDIKEEDGDENEESEQADTVRDLNVTRMAMPTSYRHQIPSSPRTPLSPKLKLYLPRPNQTESPLLRSVSPQVFRNNETNGNGDDITSQYSFSQNRRTMGNQFEIRWQNITLRANRNKLPNFIVDSPIYKLFNRNGEENVSPEFPYSPPVQHKALSAELSLPRPNDMITVNSTTSVGKLSQHNGSSGYRTILNNVSGSVFSGQLTAILGPSGVGKTMLLNSLTGRNRLDGTGSVSLIGSSNKRMSVVNVPQDDVLPGKLTTMEDLQFTSRLKNPQPGFDHRRNIERIVKHLHMEKFLHTRIDKLSGGEGRRLSIARELLSSPDIMILDEPTSGLDANTCKKIITALRDIVEHSENILDRPMSIIITIHQPQQEVLNLFHRCYVMAVGGRAIFEGPPTTILASLLERSSLGQACDVTQLNENPAIVALEVASGEYGPNIILELADYHEFIAQEDFLLYGADESVFATANQSPFSTPNQLRKPSRSPLNVTTPMQRMARNRRLALNSPDSFIGKSPKINTRRLEQLPNRGADITSSITSLSYASTYDADLPEQVGKLKVDKRLRRSVVMKTVFLSHTWTLIQRSWLLATRDMFLMSIRVIGFLLVAGGMVQIFGTLDPNEHVCPDYASEVDDLISFMETTRERISNIANLTRHSNTTHTFFFHLVLCIAMVTSALAGLVFPVQIRMFIREYKNGWYSPASFITSLTLAELPVDIIGPIISISITYPLCNQPSSEYHWRELGYALIIILVALICKSQAQIVGAFLMNSIENSVFVSCVMITPPALLSGIPLRISQMSWPLQLASYTSFLRFAFESLVSLRFGYGLCPCDPEIVNGFPTKTSQSAMPPRLDTFARGILDINSPETSLENSTKLSLEDNAINAARSFDGDDPNLFLRFVRLVTDAGNLFVPEPHQLGNCGEYRSLYLMDMGIPNRILPKWIAIMLLMFVISRFLTYLVVRAVIKMRS